MTPWDGNHYELTTTAEGVPTFRHLATGENLHGQAGPWQEANRLYVEPGRLRERSGPVVIYDVGMGCAAQVLASLNAACENPHLHELEIVSFDLEKRGLVALLDHASQFPYATPFLKLIQEVVEHDLVEAPLPGGAQLRWQFLGGDFRQTPTQKERESLPQADLIFYDFFSPAQHPELWTLRLFEWLRGKAAPGAMLFTYSCATAVRAALLAAGFYVGLGIPSGKKAKTTVAAVSVADLSEPLPQRWLQTFLASHAAYSRAESDSDRARIHERVSLHPQFKPF